MKKNKNSSIQWYLTTKQKKPFASSSVCTSDFICLLYEIHKDMRIVFENIHYDNEAKEIVKYYIDNNEYFPKLRKY